MPVTLTVGDQDTENFNTLNKIPINVCFVRKPGMTYVGQLLVASIHFFQLQFIALCFDSSTLFS